MHADEVDIDVGLVGRLVAAQFPDWAGLPLERVRSGGTDNALFRLGDELYVRMPLVERAIGQVAKDLRWLPVFRPVLPLEIPEPLALGRPGEGYPWEWGVYRWLEGETASPEGVEQSGAALDLAAFLRALRVVDTTGGPIGRRRGVPLAGRDADVQAALSGLRGEVDIDAAAAIWAQTLRAPDWRREPVWLHGDLWPANMLAREGRLTAVIDFSELCIGDPATDLMFAWTMLTAESRPVLRDALAVDDDEWERGRGWALSFGLLALPYYRDTNAVIANAARRTIAEVLADSYEG